MQTGRTTRDHAGSLRLPERKPSHSCLGPGAPSALAHLACTPPGGPGTAQLAKLSGPYSARVWRQVEGFAPYSLPLDFCSQHPRVPSCGGSGTQVTSRAQARPTPAPAREASCEYRFKNPSLGKTLMINQAADPSAAAGSGRGARGRAGARRHGVAFRASEESRSRRRRAGRALAACSRGRAGASRRGRRRRRVGQGRRGLCRLRSPDVRRRRPPAGARSMGAPLSAALGALHYLALFLQLGGATRPAGHAPWDNHVSGHGEFACRPHGLPHLTPPRPQTLQLGGCGVRTRAHRGRGPEFSGAPCWD